MNNATGYFGLFINSDLVVSNIRKGSPADGQLLIGDELCFVDGRLIRNWDDFKNATTVNAGDEAVFLVRSNGEVGRVHLKAQPKPEGWISGVQLEPCDRHWLRCDQLDAEPAAEPAAEPEPEPERGYFGVCYTRDDDGLFWIVGVDAGSPAYNAGVEVGERIFSVNGTEITGLDRDYVDRMTKANVGCSMDLVTFVNRVGPMALYPYRMYAAPIPDGLRMGPQ